MDPGHDDGRAPRPGRRIALIALGGFAAGVLATAIVLWLSAGFFGDMPIHGAPLIAALLGGGGTMAIAAGLMATLFHSSRSRWDDEIR